MPGPGQGGGIHVDTIVNGTDLLRKTLETMNNVVHWAMKGANKLTTFLSTPMDEALNDIPVADTILETLNSVLNIGDLSIMELAIGVGMPIVIVWSIVKWLKL